MVKKVHLWNKISAKNEKLLLGRVAELVGFYLEHTKDTAFSNAIKLNHATYLNSPYEELPPGFYNQLDALLATIADNRKLTDFPTAVCLCIQPDKQSVLYGWHGLVISAALEHLRLFANESRVASAVNAYRLFVTHELKEFSVEINTNVPSASLPLSQIVAGIDTYFEHKDLLQPLKRRLQPIRRILEDVYNQELKNQRIRSQSVAVKSKQSRVTKKQARVDEEEAPYIEFIEKFAGPSIKTVNPDEFGADNTPKTTFIQAETDSSVSKHIANTPALSAMYARNVADQIERREKSLVSSWSSLTEFEVSTLMGAIRWSPEARSLEAMLTYLMLVTGRRLEQLCSAKLVQSVDSFSGSGDAYSPNANENWCYWVYCPSLPGHKQSGHHRRLLNQQPGKVILVVPYLYEREIPAHYNMPKYSDELRINVESFIKRINKAHSVRLTAARIADYFSYFMHRNGVDDVIAALLTGNPSIQPAGIYYQQFNSDHLRETYNNFLRAVFKESTPRSINFAQHTYSGGSQLQVKDEVIVMLFSHLRGEVGNSNSLIDFHNSYTLYVLHLLNFATGHRPVRDPFEDIRSIDLNGGKIFISDKEARDVDASRTLIIPSAAIEQVNAYLAHLAAIKEHLAFINPESAVYLEKVFEGAAPYLFFLSTDEANAVTAITPRIVKKEVSEYFDLPLNWNRHYLRTLLSSQGITGETIDTWMGHAKPGQEGLAKYSGLSIKDLKEVADCIQQQMNIFEIEKLDGWSAGHG